MKTIDMENRLIIVAIVLVACVWQIHGNALGKLDNEDGSQNEAGDTYGIVRRATNQLAPGAVDKETKLDNGQKIRKNGKVRRATKRINKTSKRIAKRQALEENGNEKRSENELEDGKERGGIMRRASNLMFKIAERIVKRQAKKAKDTESTNDRREIHLAKREGKRSHQGGKSERRK
ncbi:uncharacterized protein LOC110455787 [Mizuhopecten yessoensis]|uniref:Uncharacterized protein n=1 Tax=Mizuhopecten yessoensis TaxID=6573 RepID=A0A210R3X2_MIZYE|nr:uncharacterized protein LOC110455787 [Mizuhopecten yessoensis]OWF55773.1 hypothetical protein KP79_PYT23828 [Mizuhopecten yessoensis]